VVHSTRCENLLVDWSNLAAVVENLWMNGAKAVQKMTAQIFLRQNRVTIAIEASVHAVFAPPFA
jgi:hypothetical protein